MDLSERKKKILQAIVDEYIRTADPVGSRAISKKENLGLSSATIRNEMADLEEMGYLIQPHTSAGRIPSDEGYRFYVNSLMQYYQIGLEAIAQLQQVFAARVTQLDSLIRRAGAMVSALTDYTTLITAPARKHETIRKIDLVKIGYDKIMLLVVTHTAQSHIMTAKIDDSSCVRLAEILNKNLAGLKADEINFGLIQSLQEQISEQISLPAKVLINILNFVYETISEPNDAEIYLDNANAILKYPEYADIDKAREMVSFLEDKENLKKLVENSDEEGISARIGKENDLEILKDCSIVTVNYSLDDRASGKLAVIGPKRMNYAKVFASLDRISSEIDKILKEYISYE